MAVNKEKINIGILKLDEFEFSLQSFSYRDGFPQRTVQGSPGAVFFGTNYEEAKGMMKAAMKATKEYDDAIRQLRERKTFTAQYIEFNGEFTKVMEAGTLINDDETSVGNEGVIEITIEGTPLS